MALAQIVFDSSIFTLNIKVKLNHHIIHKYLFKIIFAGYFA